MRGEERQHIKEQKQKIRRVEIKSRGNEMGRVRRGDMAEEERRGERKRRRGEERGKGEEERKEKRRGGRKGRRGEEGEKGEDKTERSGERVIEEI